MSETKKNIPVATIIFSIISLIVGLTIGIFYQKSKTPSFSSNGQFQMGSASGARGVGGTGQKNRASGAASFRQTIGDVISADDKSITVKMADGSSKIVLISDTTSINQSTTASKTDLKVGAKVAVMGDQNTDGSITGRTINLNPTVPKTTVTPTAKQ